MNLPNLSKTKTKQSILDLEKRTSSFMEVSLGYNETEAINEAKRCLNCKNKPCVNGCPLNNNIPEFIQKVAVSDFESAYTLIKEKSNFPAICSRICAHCCSSSRRSSSS